MSISSKSDSENWFAKCLPADGFQMIVNFCEINVTLPVWIEMLEATMVSYCKSTLVGLTVAAGACFLSSSAYAAQYAAQNWEYARYENSLPDGSVLTEYAGNSLATKLPRATFRVGFIPRFGCAPLISLRNPLNSNGDGVDAKLISSYTVPEFSIDGTPMRFPSLVEVVENQVLFYFNNTLARRVKLRLQIDEGLFANLKLSDGQAHAFSLLGSQAVLEYAENQCRLHVPDS